MTATTRAVGIGVTGVGQVEIETSDLSRARVFYLVRLGFTLLADEADEFTFSIGNSSILVRRTDRDAAAGGDGDLPGRAHIILVCANSDELRRAAALLTSAGIEHSDVALDPGPGTERLTFRDPDDNGWTLCAT